MWRNAKSWSKNPAIFWYMFYICSLCWLQRKKTVDLPFIELNDRLNWIKSPLNRKEFWANRYIYMKSFIKPRKY